MFAYNEQNNIASSIVSIYKNSDEKLNIFFLIANGCTDNTVQIAEKEKARLGFSSMQVVSLDVGDKCNAWNHYVHNLSGTAKTHFFVDADVKFSENCFPKMHTALQNSEEQTVTIAGMPLTGRNIQYYRSLVIEHSCFFGNLYGLKDNFIKRIQKADFHLPKGLNWIDSFLTKAVNTDLNFFNYNLKKRVIYLEDVGYYFDSLSPLRFDDIRLYVNRIARYELGKLQENHLDNIDVNNWPKEMKAINEKIYANFSEESSHLPLVKRVLVKRRLQKIIGKRS